MKEDKAAWYEIESLHPKHLPLTDGLNRLYRLQTVECNRLQVPEEFGQGFREKFKVNPSVEISVCDVSFHENIMMRSREQDHFSKWSFCVGDPIEWTEESSDQSCQLKAGEMSIFGHSMANCLGYYQAGKQIHGVTVKLDPEFLTVLQQHFAQRSSIFSSDGYDSFQKSVVTPSMNRIIQEIIRCDYAGEIKRIYMEGKVLELIAVYLHEETLRTSEVSGLSRTDVDSLLQAKEILDHDLLSAPSINQLSRQVCLNEFKLKKGFKQLFGISVHAYVIDQRLEAAYLLLEKGSITITMAAVMSGFNKPSHFAEKFRQKYGATPSGYFRQSIR